MRLRERGNNDSEIYSFHSGGANVLRADGSVMFLRESVSAATVGAMATRANGEVFRRQLIAFAVGVPHSFFLFRPLSASPDGEAVEGGGWGLMEC